MRVDNDTHVSELIRWTARGLKHFKFHFFLIQHSY